MRSNALNKRLEVLEERAKPRMISTLADLVLWRAKGCKEDVELSPELHELVDKAADCASEH
jgi:hypothetical protein